AIQAVPSACSRQPPPGRGALRSKTPILSSPRKPPSKRFFPKRSFRFTHQVKFTTNFLKQRFRKSRLPSPCRAFWVRYRNIAAQACTGGFTSLKFHSYAGICPVGCRKKWLNIRSSCCCAKSTSTVDNAIVWNAKSQAAYQG